MTEFWHDLTFAVGAVLKTQQGQMNWPLVLSTVATALVLWIGASQLKQNDELARISERQLVNNERIQRLEDQQAPATAKRYTSEDAARDLKLMREEIRYLQEQITQLRAGRK